MDSQLQSSASNRLTSSSTFQKFYHKLSHGGYLLFLSALVALIWSNVSPASYDHFWHLPFTMAIGDTSVEMSLAHLVNDVFMTFFFFTVGLEIKREFLVGALADSKKAIMPVSAALGGMIAPALVFFLLNQQMPEAKGWGIPMATDIAFSLAILSILGSRVPFGIRLFLTSFAIADDLGAVAVIAIFYTPEINIANLLYAFPLLTFLVFLNHFWIRYTLLYLVAGILLWWVIASSGLHTTISGVIIAMFIPAKGKYDMSTFIDVLNVHASTIKDELRSGNDIMLNRSHLNAVQSIDLACHDVKTPLQRLELLHAQFVSVLILPLFALANTGLVLSDMPLDQIFSNSITLGIILGLVFGKSIGVFSGTYLATKIFRLPLFEGVTWGSLIGVGFLGGVGFTMSLFIAGLSFVHPEQLNYAKSGIIVGSFISGILGFLILKKSLPRQN